MVQRFALLVGGLGAAGVLAFALGLGNFVLIGSTDAVSADQAPADLNTLDATQPAAPDQIAVTTDQQPQVVVKKVRDTVYIAPPGKAPVVRVKQASGQQTASGQGCAEAAQPAHLYRARRRWPRQRRARIRAQPWPQQRAQRLQPRRG